MMNSYRSLIRFVNNVNLVSTRGLKSDLHIKWVRPEKIACWDPKKSGDLSPLEPLDMTKFPLEFQDSEELKTANEYVRKVFSCDFMGRRFATQLARQKIIDKVKSNKLDFTSCEVQIASMTANIRNLQEHYKTSPRDKNSRVALKEIIDKRKKRLKYLRTWDYKKFEWLLENLDLKFHPHPPYQRIERKASLRKLTNEWCNKVKEEKLSKLRNEFDNDKEQFLKQKLETFEWIKKEEIECGVPPTITDVDIENARKQLEDWKALKSIKEE